MHYEVAMIQADPIDAMVGQVIKALRLERDISQTQLGASIGASLREIELFESGARRVGAARLMRIAKAFDVDVAVFFDDGAGPGEAAEPPDIVREAVGGTRDSPSRSVH